MAVKVNFFLVLVAYRMASKYVEKLITLKRLLYGFVICSSRFKLIVHFCNCLNGRVNNRMVIFITPILSCTPGLDRHISIQIEKRFRLKHLSY